MFHGITKTIRIKENMQVKTLVFKRFSNASWSTPFFFFFFSFYFCLSSCVSRILFRTRNILNRSSSNCSIFVSVIRQKQKKSIYVIFSSFYYPCEFSVRSVCWLDFLCLKFLSYISLFRWEMRALLLPVQTKVFFLAKRNTQYGSRNVAINKRLITLTPAS